MNKYIFLVLLCFVKTVFGTTNVIGNLNVQLTVADYCVVAFNYISSGQSNVFYNSSSLYKVARIQCTEDTPWTISANAGNVSGSTIANRLLTNGAEYLNFNIYVDSNWSSILGDGISGGQVISGVGSGDFQNVNIYYKVDEPLIIPSAGTYSNSITLTLTY
jgi:spore coat protein U-like protein